MNSKLIRWGFLPLGWLCAGIGGCGLGPDEVPAPAPRPVAVLELRESDPGRFDRFTGTIVSWKTDQLGFEVAGRVEFVVEPETQITGQVVDAQGSVVSAGTELARLDPTRYQLNVESAKADVAAQQQQRDAAQIELDSVIPAQLEAAQAQFALARTEVERNEKLVAENAAAARALDLARAKQDEATANLKQLEATRQAKRAEVAALEAKIGQLQEAQRQAERDLADCRLLWSVPGQVADVHVIAGSYVERGEPVVTVQMMHPIKVEFEVSAATARTLNHRDPVSVYLPQPDGAPREMLAYIYTIDAVADPTTRTFTITLMLPNQRVRGEPPAAEDGQVVARTDTIGRMIRGFGLQPDTLFVNEKYLQQDAEGSYLWKIVGESAGTSPGSSSRLLQVRKVRVVPGELRIPILGLAVLRDLRLEEGESFDPAVDLITGSIRLPEGSAEPWSGDRVFLDLERWELRPGDIVSVSLARQQTTPGFYVPLDAILERSGQTYVFLVESTTDGDTVRQVEVRVSDPVGTLRRIEAAGGQPLSAGQKIVARGAAFVVDGERVSVADEVEVRR
ncbi:MAG: HlyD family efflux transporter periplasmic adaptor subunit [Pirellulaceae bacterium]|nr:HlyD family efflux transporter periplasmic adaptor subunit [Pirellulaceae bacterium]